MTEEIFREDAYVKTCEAVITHVGEQGVTLDRTVFYPTGGGQPGDSGVLRCADGREVAVLNTIKGEGGTIIHVLEDGADVPAVGEAVSVELDWERRHRHMRMHTCLHLLCSLVEGGVTGGGIGDGRGRIDFDLPDTALDKEAITAELNRLIDENHAVTQSWITDDEMAQRAELVRTMSVKPPSGQGRVRLMEIAGVDLQPCGGTHVRATGEIGRVRVGKIENKGKHNRRVNVLFDD